MARSSSPEIPVSTWKDRRLGSLIVDDIAGAGCRRRNRLVATFVAGAGGSAAQLDTAVAWPCPGLVQPQSWRRPGPRNWHLRSDFGRPAVRGPSSRCAQPIGALASRFDTSLPGPDPDLRTSHDRIAESVACLPDPRPSIEIHPETRCTKTAGCSQPFSVNLCGTTCKSAGCSIP